MLRIQGAGFEKQNLESTIKLGESSLMIWGCVAESGVGRLSFIGSTLDHMARLVGCRDKVNCPHVGPGIIGRNALCGFFLRDLSAYLCKYRKKNTKPTNC